jgi:tetratricopeptide (TPR) repeat protein
MAEGVKQPSPDDVESAQTRRPPLGPVGKGLLLVAVALGAGLLGVGSGRLLWPARDAADHRGAGRAHERAPTPRQATTPPAGLILDPRSPLPETAQGLIEEATRVIDRLQKAFPDDTDCLEMKARLADWVGKSEQAVQTWERCLELDPEYAHAYVGMATVAAKAGDHPKAEELARKAMQIAPESFLARSVLAESLLHLGRAEEVEPVLADFLDADPRSHGYFLLGQAHWQMHRYEKAKHAYQSAVRKYADYAEAYFGLARACTRLGREDEASAAMARYRELMAEREPTRAGGMHSPSSDLESVRLNVATVYTDTARVCLARGKRRLAERLWRRAASLDPENVECRHALVSLYGSEGKVLKTVQTLEQLAKTERDNPSYWIEIGRLRAGLLQFDLAEEALREACRVAPQNGACHAALATFLLRSNRSLADAVTVARTAVECEPTAAHYAILAMACRAGGDRPGALAAIEQAVTQEPEDPAYRQLDASIRAEP